MAESADFECALASPDWVFAVLLGLANEAGTLLSGLRPWHVDAILCVAFVVVLLGSCAAAIWGLKALVCSADPCGCVPCGPFDVLP